MTTVAVRPSPSSRDEWVAAALFCTIAYDKRMVPITCVGSFDTVDLALACGDELRDVEGAATVMVYPLRPPEQESLLSLIK